MESFTPLNASLGGVLVVLAAAVLWLGNGRIAGMLDKLWNLLVALVAGSLAGSVLIPSGHARRLAGA